MDVKILASADEMVLTAVAEGVFDDPVQSGIVAQFLADPRHHLCVAIADGLVVGMASGVTYVHPDKPLEMWINEVGVGDAWRERGVGRAVVQGLLDEARRLGCREAWVLTDEDNTAARALYRGRGGVEAERLQLMVSFAL